MIAKYLFIIGFGLLFLGILLIIVSSLIGTGKGESKAAVGGIIGFIPFGFANDKAMLWFIIIFSAAMFVFFVLMNYLWK